MRHAMRNAVQHVMRALLYSIETKKIFFVSMK